jgi:hypothetical protein
MAIEEAVQQQRGGNLADLPILLAGEFGYALDAKRLFIGNTTASLNGDGATVAFSFGVDLDHAAGESYKLYVDDALQTESVHYTKSNLVYTFTTAPASGTGNIELKYNSEVYLFEPDVGLDVPGLVSISSASGTLPIAFDGDRYDNADIRYSLRNAVGHIRKGVLSIAVDVPTDTHTISDNYTNNATTAGSLLDHVFTGTMVAGIFTLQYTTTDTADANLSWLTDNFKASV